MTDDANNAESWTEHLRSEFETGAWPFASGSQSADWIAGPSMMREGGLPIDASAGRTKGTDLEASMVGHRSLLR